MTREDWLPLNVVEAMRRPAPEPTVERQRRLPRMPRAALGPPSRITYHLDGTMTYEWHAGETGPAEEVIDVAAREVPERPVPNALPAANGDVVE